jgi:DNA-binding NarL/FixJ family response regulator
MLIDDHAAVRAGLETVLAAEPDLIPVASTDGTEDVWPRFHQTRPDLVLLDFHIPGQNTLVMCRRLKAVVPTPRVVFYSAYADASLGVPLRLAGADGLVSKGSPATELFEVVRTVAAGDTVLPALTPDLLEATSEALSYEDRMLTGLLLDGTSMGDVADVLRVEADEARMRVDRLLDRVVPSDPRPAVAR